MTGKSPTLRVKRLRPDAILPTYGSPGAIGLDLYACGSPVLYLPQGMRAAIPTGIAVAIPEGYYGRIAPRSGLAFKDGIDVLAGVIDNDYRGEIKVIMINHNFRQFMISDGIRIAQLILERADRADLQEAEDLDETLRGTGGFGSTGQ